MILGSSRIIVNWKRSFCRWRLYVSLLAALGGAFIGFQFLSLTSGKFLLPRPSFPQSATASPPPKKKSALVRSLELGTGREAKRQKCSIPFRLKEMQFSSNSLTTQTQHLHHTHPILEQVVASYLLSLLSDNDLKCRSSLQPGAA